MPKLLKIKTQGEYELVDEPIPTVGEGQILVKNVAVAQNPIDWQCIYTFYDPAHDGSIAGCDYAGVVTSVGPGVTRYKEGDRVAGFLFGNMGRKNIGSFAEYVVGDADISLKIPDTLSFEDAATLGVAVTTIGQALYQSLQLPWPTEPAKEPFPILIYGGSSAMGTMAIQVAKLSGATVVTTASPHNFDLVTSFGADKVFDYHDPDVAAKIKEYTGGKLAKAVDTICLPGTTDIIVNSIGEAGGKVHNLQYIDMSSFRKDVEQGIYVGFSAFGETYTLKGFEFPGLPENRAESKKFWALAEKLLAQGKLKIHPVKILPNGLAGIFDGLQVQRQWKVSGQKFVYRIADTPGLAGN